MTRVESIVLVTVALVGYPLLASCQKNQMDPKEVFAKTIYGEARGEPDEGQKWVAWVIKNRAAQNKPEWGGNSVEGVCLAPRQFEPWNGKDDIPIDDKATYDKIKAWTDKLYDAPQNQDPTGGADYFNNPDKEGFPPWTQNVDKLRKIGNHQFYKSRK